MGAGQTFIDQLELVAKRLRCLLNLFGSLQSFTKENRAYDFVACSSKIGFAVGERAPNQTRFLGRFAEQRRIGIFTIEVTHDGERLVEDEVSIFESGHLAARVEPKIGR